MMDHKQQVTIERPTNDVTQSNELDQLWRRVHELGRLWSLWSPKLAWELCCDVCRELKPKLSELSESSRTLSAAYFFCSEQADCEFWANSKYSLPCPNLMQVQKKDYPSLDQRDLEEAFSYHDKDGSGALSLSEWQTLFEETVQSMLNDGDSDHLTEEERVAHQ